MSPISLTEFADRINELMPEMIREFTKRQTNELFKGTITLPQFLILTLLYKKEESRMTDVAHFLNVTTAAATGLVDRLVKYDYVRRVYEPKDRRIIKIKLTAKGTELVKKICEQRRQMIMEIFGKISQPEREDYLKILTRMHQILTQEEGQ